MTSAPDFLGQVNRECGEHRTVGSHRAWCYDCQEWCYPGGPCKGCELPDLRARRDAALHIAREMREQLMTGPELADVERIIAVLSEYP